MLIIAVLISGLVALVLYKLISPSSGSQTSFTYARKWTAYVAATSIFPLLGMFILNDSGNNLTKIVAAIVLWIPVFLLGWMYGAWKMRKPPITAAKISNEEAEPAQTNDQPINDSDLYLKATLEVDTNAQEPALWAKAMTLCEGDEGKAKYKYINLRVEYLTNNPIKETLEDAPLATEQPISDQTEESKENIERLSKDAQKDIEKIILCEFASTGKFDALRNASLGSRSSTNKVLYEDAAQFLKDKGYIVSSKDYGWLIVSPLGQSKKFTSIEELSEYATSKR